MMEAGSASAVNIFPN